MFKRTILLIPVFLILASLAFFQGCGQDEVNSPTANNIGNTDVGCPQLTTPIYAGQTINAGNLVVWNDLTNLYVKYQFNTGFTANTLHLWVGCDLLQVPLSGGNNPQPVPGQFPYSYNLNGGNTYTFTIPLTAVSNCGINFGCPNSPANIYVLAHAEVNTPSNGGQTGWSYTGNTACGKSFEQQWGSNRWGWITCYTFCCDPVNNNPPETTSETAFAKLYKATSNGALGGYVWTFGTNSNPEGYPSINLNRNRWGWAAKLNASMIPSTGNGLSFQLWAGAGLNNTANGTLVGTVYVKKSGTDVVVTFSTTSPYTFSEVHIYLDNATPTTIAPGQYGNTYSYNPAISNQSYTFPMPTGDFWFIGHCVAQIPVTP